MKPTISLGYADFWPGFNPETDFFTRLLRWRFDIRLSGRPDFLLAVQLGLTLKLLGSLVAQSRDGVNHLPLLEDPSVATHPGRPRP